MLLYHPISNSDDSTTVFYNLISTQLATGPLQMERHLTSINACTWQSQIPLQYLCSMVARLWFAM